MKKNLIKILRSEFFRNIRSKQPYRAKIFDIELLVAEDVFPPEIGLTTTHLAKIVKNYNSSKTALDMGCGTGFLALMMRKHGIPIVWAVDISEPAIACTLENEKLNSHLAPLHVVHSDLFSSIPIQMKFDLIIFNHPYYPTIGTPVFGYNPDGGKQILNKFFKSVSGFIHKNSKILVPYSSIAESDHDPAIVVSNLKIFKVNTLLTFSDENGHHKIYEITFNTEI